MGVRAFLVIQQDCENNAQVKIPGCTVSIVWSTPKDTLGETTQQVYIDKKAMNEKDFKAKHATGLFPLLETADG